MTGGWLEGLSHGLASLAAALGLATAEPEALRLQGYVEGKALHLAAPLAGTLAKLSVTEGARVEAGAPLFAIDDTLARAERDRAAATLAQERARLADLKAGKREPEIAIIRAQIEQAEASLRLSEAELERQAALVRRGTAPVERLDQARATAERDRARVAELKAQLESALLPARPHQLAAAESAVRIAEAGLAQAERRLAELAPTAPAPAIVEEVFYAEGEWVPANAPVLSLLPGGALKVRFFLPEPLLGQVRIGEEFGLRCGGCPPGLTARLVWIAPRAEFTPPVIYSTERREKLVWMAEAEPADTADRLHPGQPVELILERKP